MKIEAIDRLDRTEVFVDGQFAYSTIHTSRLELEHLRRLFELIVIDDIVKIEFKVGKINE